MMNTDRERIEEAFRLSYEEASVASDMGQLNAYRVNRLVSLMEKARDEGRREPRKITEAMIEAAARAIHDSPAFCPAVPWEATIEQDLCRQYARYAFEAVAARQPRRTLDDLNQAAAYAEDGKVNLTVAEFADVLADAREEGRRAALEAAEKVRADG